MHKTQVKSFGLIYHYVSSRQGLVTTTPPLLVCNTWQISCRNLFVWKSPSRVRKHLKKHDLCILFFHYLGDWRPPSLSGIDKSCEIISTCVHVVSCLCLCLCLEFVNLKSRNIGGLYAFYTDFSCHKTIDLLLTIVWGLFSWFIYFWIKGVIPHLILLKNEASKPQPVHSARAAPK